MNQLEFYSSNMIANMSLIFVFTFFSLVSLAQLADFDFLD